LASTPERSIDTRNAKGEPLLSTTHIAGSHVGTIPSVTTRAQVAVTVAQDSVRAAKVTAVLIKRLRFRLQDRGFVRSIVA
jgi:hypothetical protein